MARTPCAPRGTTACTPPGRFVDQDRTSSWIGYAAAISALFLIGTSAPVAARLGDYPLLDGQAVRFWLAAFVLTAVLWARGGRRASRLTVRDVAGVLLLALIGIAGFNVFLVAASRQADPAVVGTVLAAAPVALAVLGPVVRHRRPSPRVVGGCVLVALGTVVAAGLGGSSMLGLLLCAGGLACEIAFSLLAVPLIDRLGTLRTTTYAVCVAAILLTIAGLASGGSGSFLRVPNHDELLCLVYLALAIAVAANLLWYAALPRIGADYAGLFYAVTPAGALLAGIALDTSAPTTGELIGLGVTATGLLVGLKPRPGTTSSRT